MVKSGLLPHPGEESGRFPWLIGQAPQGLEDLDPVPIGGTERDRRQCVLKGRVLIGAIGRQGRACRRGMEYYRVVRRQPLGYDVRPGKVRAGEEGA